MYDIAVIGGGASGLVSAIAAADCTDNAARICVLDRMDRVGKKLLSTGNGKCNLANTDDRLDFFYGKNRPLIAQVLADFGTAEVLHFFQRLGLLCSADEAGRIYPHCRQASAVLDILRHALSIRQIQEECGFDVVRIEPKKGFFILHSASGAPIQAKKVILAAGGQAMKNLGSNGSGFHLAKNLGHRLTNIYPALVKLKTSDPITKTLNGIKVLADAAAYIDGAQVCATSGEILFTDFGLSGIPIMQLSRFYGEKRSRSDMEIQLDLLPDMDISALLALLLARRDANEFETLETFLVGILNKKVGYALLKKSGLAPLSLSSATLTNEQLRALADTIKGLTLPITGDLSWSHAQVTGGGVDSAEFDPMTLESTLIPGFYACGEVLDVFGDCGGYNLHWAWASGYKCGTSAGAALH